MSTGTPRELHDTDPNRTGSDEDDGDLPPGTMVGEYRVEHRIGAGGMGIVFAAVHPLIGKRVAIKVLKPDVCNDSVAVERFIDEARVVNHIEHPNIVDIFAFGQLPDGRHYFVMEWLRGESLRARLERSRMRVSEVCDILAPLARALVAAHDRGIVHRDLKPDNIFLVDSRGATQVKLLDFGVAKLAKPDQQPKRLSHTATGTIVGTPQYLSPEQAKGYIVDHRADLYALGGIAFEALTGRPPFVADNAMEMVAKHLMEAPTRPSIIATNVPFELDELVVSTLAKDPDDRPTLAEWLDVLERARDEAELASSPRVARVYANTPVPGQPLIAPFTPWPGTPPAQPQIPSTPLPVVTPPRRLRTWLVVAVVALAVIALGLYVMLPARDAAAPAASRSAPAPQDMQQMKTTQTAPTIAPAIAPTPAPAELPAAPPAHHHHHHVVAPPQPGAPEQAPVDDPNDLLAPGSIPAGSGSGSAGQGSAT